MSWCRRAGASLVVLLLLSAVRPVAADMGDARVHFEQGRVALAEGRLVDAREHLRAAYELFPHRATAFNLLVALRGLERPSEATPLCRALLGGEHGRLGRTEEQQVRAVCASVEEQWAAVHVSIVGAPSASVTIDGRVAGEVARGDAIEQRLDPGAHVIAVAAPAHAGEQRRVVLSRGESLRLEVPVVPLMAMPTELVNAHDGASPWTYVLAIGGGVLAAIAIAVAILATSSENEEPIGSEWLEMPVTGFRP
jgi:hypothetical protein